MGKKGSWFSSLKKALSPKKSKSKKERDDSKVDRLISSREETSAAPAPAPAPAPVPAPYPPPTSAENVKLAEAENENTKHAYSVAIATAMAAEAAVAAAQAAAEVVRLTSMARSSGKSKDEIAVIKIQAVFRGYLARKALRSLKGLMRLKALLQGQSVKRQATSTLRAMQTLAYMQSQIRSRVRISQENLALQRQLQQKHDKELEKLRASQSGEQWDDSLQSKERVEANLLHKQEATMRRERALAYAFSHQQAWRNYSKSTNPAFMDPSNLQWDWSWLERWMVVRPWDSRTVADNNDHASIKSTTSRAMSIGEISRAYSQRGLKQAGKHSGPSSSAQKPSRPPSRQSPSTPPSTASVVSSVTGSKKPPSSKETGWIADDDYRSMRSFQYERYRRHSIAGSSVRDDESLTSSPSAPNYMAPTKSAKAKSRTRSPLGPDKNGTYWTPDTGSLGSVKKRLFVSASPAGQRRHSGPPRLDLSIIKDTKVQMDEKFNSVGNNS